MDENQRRGEVLFEIKNATVIRATGETAFDDLAWTMREGETWAIVGPTGSGKSSLTEVLLGRLRVTTGTIKWPLLDRLRAAGRPIAWPSEIVARVGFKEESRLFSYGRHYYQQRFNFIEPDDDLTLDQFLHAGTSVAEETMVRVTAQLGIGHLRELSFIKMSNGQTRRARIARALLAHPEVLILDEPFVGLDVDGRREVGVMLQQLAANGTRLILITSPTTIPDWVSHVLALNEGRIVHASPHADYLPPPNAPATAFRSSSAADKSEPVLVLQNVNVTYGGTPILRDVSWTVRAGERWALLGPNGSGKTTLLSLLCGDHPQAYSNDITVFGRKRGDGESIWDVKRRIGLVSPEMHLYFSEPLTAREVAATGFFDVLVKRMTTVAQDAHIQELFTHFAIPELADRPFAQLSTGQQRIVLLVRSLVKDPPLLILDEPFQTLDAATITRAREWIDDRIAPDRTVIFVTHNEAELPRSVTRRLQLLGGMVVEGEHRG